MSSLNAELKHNGGFQTSQRDGEGKVPTIRVASISTKHLSFQLLHRALPTVPDPSQFLFNPHKNHIKCLYSHLHIPRKKLEAQHCLVKVLGRQDLKLDLSPA